jgi:hypothetical protein
MPVKKASLDELVALAKAAAAEAANYQERFAAEDTEARKIVDIMERYLRVKGRVVYGGAAINAHMSPEHKFYDPALNLPDYDFMTPDPLQDCADLIVTFQQEGFVDVEAKFGIHEGTYKIFVNYRSAADITYMPPDIYERISKDADTIDGIRYASVNFLRMNIYLELSRPAGDVKRWEKVYERLLLLNEDHPLKAGHCTAEPLEALGASRSSSESEARHDRIVGAGIAAGAIFISGAAYLASAEPRSDEVVLMISDRPAPLVSALTDLGLKLTAHPAMGELLPARTELRTGRRKLVAVVFETVACHSYTTLPSPAGYRLGSIDLLIQMYYAMYFADLQGYLPVRLLCVIQELIAIEAARRSNAAISGTSSAEAHDVFPLECIGHQPTMPELKKAHRQRVLEKRKDLAGALRIQSAVRPSRRTRRYRK